MTSSNSGTATFRADTPFSWEKIMSSIPSVSLYRCSPKKHHTPGNLIYMMIFYSLLSVVGNKFSRSAPVRIKDDSHRSVDLELITPAFSPATQTAPLRFPFLHPDTKTNATCSATLVVYKPPKKFPTVIFPTKIVNKPAVGVRKHLYKLSFLGFLPSNRNVNTVPSRESASNGV